MSEKATVLYGPRGHEIRLESSNRSQIREAVTAIERLAQGGGGRAAKWQTGELSRLTEDWHATDSDINTVLASQLPTLRKRSRWLAQNNPYGASAVNTLINFCVGTGFELQMQAVKQEPTSSGEFEIVERDEYNELVEELFGDWGEDVNWASSVGSPESWLELQQLLTRRLIEDGEFFVRYHIDKSQPIVPLKLEPIDPGCIDSSKTTNPDNGNPVVLGVELDKTTLKPVAYWLTVLDLSSGSAMCSRTKSVRVASEDMLHVFIRKYPRQLRGIPFSATVGEKFFQAESYNNALLVRQKLAAMVALIFEDIGGSGVGGNMPGLGGEGMSEGDRTDSKGNAVDSYGNRVTDMAPGMVLNAPPGKKASILTPQAPESAFRDYLAEQIKAVGAGYEVGVSYTGLTRDTRQTTFAGGRQAENIDIQGYRPFMSFLGKRALSPIMRKWMDVAVLSGAVQATLYFEGNARAAQRHKWMPAGWNRGINPLQDANASKVLMAEGITTLPDECAQRGLDWKLQVTKRARVNRRILKEYAKTKDLAIELKLTPEETEMLLGRSAGIALPELSAEVAASFSNSAA